MSTLNRFLEPRWVVGMALSQGYPHYLVAHLPLEFMARQGNTFLCDYIQVRVPSPRNLISDG